MKPPRSVLLCTVGTSLIYPNLKSLSDQLVAGTVPENKRALAEAYRDRNWPAVVEGLLALPGSERTCGAEINSIHSMIARKHITPNCTLYFYHSATPEGRDIGRVLRDYFRGKGHAQVETREIADLQDDDPRRFRGGGLRNLARELCLAVRAHSPANCAINATGGYKAQIAIAVLMGQALGISVYYMHERFSEIISFPPMPVALDYELWLRASGLLKALDRGAVAKRQLFEEEWDERYESLVLSVEIDGEEYLELSPAGLIFQEAFRDRFRTTRDQVLPPPVPAGSKREPMIKGDEGHLLKYRDEVVKFLQRTTAAIGAVKQCRVHYFNPDLPQPTRFRESKGQVEGVYSDGTMTVKFWVDTSAQTEGQRAAVVAALNDWLGDA